MYKLKVFILIVSLGVALVLSSQSQVSADVIFEWSGFPITGEAGSEHPTFYPSGSAIFHIEDNVLKLTLTYTGATEQILGVNQALTGFLWDITDPELSLTLLSVNVPSGSSLVNPLSGTTNITGTWDFESDLNAGLSPTGVLLGSYGVGAVGDINFGADTFGPGVGGVNYSIVGPNVNYNSDGYKSQGPMVQNSLIFTFQINSDLTDNEIVNGQPMFGSDGAFLAPEPATLLLLGSGLVGIGVYGRRRFRIRRS